MSPRRVWVKHHKKPLRYPQAIYSKINAKQAKIMVIAFFISGTMWVFYDFDMVGLSGWCSCKGAWLKAIRLSTLKKFT